MNRLHIIHSLRYFLWRTLFTALAFAAGTAASAAPGPKPGDVAANFRLATLDDRAVELEWLLQKGPVVLVVLRGWPGYQCPLCTRQVQDFIAQATRFEEHHAQVVMVYPGPADQLQAHASEFLLSKDWPAHFTFALDPDYAFTKAYGLRWDAKRETAYPSTFVIERGGKIRFTHVSESHGNRVTAARVLAVLK